MIVKDKLLVPISGLSLFLFVIILALPIACSDDPESTNEEELITNVSITLTPSEGPVVTLSWNDENLDGIVDADELEHGILLADKLYVASIELLNKSVEPPINITEEVQAEAEDHIFCFEDTGVVINILATDEDQNELPIGLLSIWTTSDPGTGTVKIELLHQPGVKTGDCHDAGETDMSITFNIIVEAEDPE